MQSLKAQIITRVLITLFVTLLLSMVISHIKALHEIEEIFDAELAQTAKMINKFTLARIDSNDTPKALHSHLSNGKKAHKYEKHISYQIWYRNALVLKSSSAPEQSLHDQAGYADRKIGKTTWRIFGLHPENSPYRIYSAESGEARKELSWEFAIESLSIFFWVLPVLGLLILVTVNKSLRPLTNISTQVRQLDVNKLHTLEINDIPKEIDPLINALNDLLSRLDIAMVRERQFSADAAHELRTPLSAIKLHTQLAQRANSAQDQQNSLDRIIKAVDQSTHLVEQLLTLSRLDHSGIELSMSQVQLQDICQSLKEDLSALAQERGISVTFTASELPSIESHRELLHTVLRNLLDNAIRYAFPDTEIKCNIQLENKQVIVQISDNGPGIPEDQLDQVNQRFYRLAGQEIKGCGLGLAITQQAIKHLDATLTLANRQQASGLVATLTLPLQGHE